jgi:hypothetical protein
MRFTLTLLVLAVVLSGAAIGETPAPVQDLTSIDELRAQFERDAGRARLVLLLSPT